MNILKMETLTLVFGFILLSCQIPINDFFLGKWKGEMSSLPWEYPYGGLAEELLVNNYLTLNNDGTGKYEVDFSFKETTWKANLIQTVSWKEINSSSANESEVAITYYKDAKCEFTNKNNMGQDVENKTKEMLCSKFKKNEGSEHSSIKKIDANKISIGYLIFEKSN